jgi:hypothetical protein
MRVVAPDEAAVKRIQELHVQLDACWERLMAIPEPEREGCVVREDGSQVWVKGLTDDARAVWADIDRLQEALGEVETQVHLPWRSDQQSILIGVSCELGMVFDSEALVLSKLRQFDFSTTVLDLGTPEPRIPKHKLDDGSKLTVTPQEISGALNALGQQRPETEGDEHDERALMTADARWAEAVRAVIWDCPEVLWADRGDRDELLLDLGWEGSAQVPEEIVERVRLYWQDWINFLRAAQDHGGFTVGRA